MARKLETRKVGAMSLQVGWRISRLVLVSGLALAGACGGDKAPTYGGGFATYDECVAAHSDSDSTEREVHRECGGDDAQRESALAALDSGTERRPVTTRRRTTTTTESTTTTSTTAAPVSTTPPQSFEELVANMSPEEWEAMSPEGREAILSMLALREGWAQQEAESDAERLERWENSGGSGDDSGAVYYENCDAARSAGDAPLYYGEAGYREGLDSDGDGEACEFG